MHFENAADRVVLRLADGRELEADILVGADGIDSVVRAQLHGAAEPRPGGWISWLALAPFRHPAVAEGDSVHYWGPGVRVGIHDIGHSRTYWWASMSTAPELAANWPHGKADVLTQVSQLVPGNRRNHLCNSRMRHSHTAHIRSPSAVVVGSGRVTLLGDAAHPMLPSLGQGANAAIEDALVLAHALTLQTDPVSALRSYERRRLGRTTALVTRSRLLARIEQYANPAAVAGRNALLRHVSEKWFIDLFTMAMYWPGFGDRERSAPLPRPLAPLERWHWTVDQVAPLHIIARVRVSGRIQVSALRAALDLLGHRHPLLRATIWSDRGANPQFVADHRPIPLRLVRHGDWVSEIDHELRERFDPRGPFCAPPSSPSRPTCTTSSSRRRTRSPTAPPSFPSRARCSSSPRTRRAGGYRKCRPSPAQNDLSPKIFAALGGRAGRWSASPQMRPGTSGQPRCG